MKNFRAYLTELTGTFFLVFVGCGTIAAAQTNAGIGHLGIALAFGVIVTINIYALGHISGCHINPAVTIAFASVRLFPWKNVVPYIIFQIIGAILAAFLGYAIFSDQIFLSVTTPVQGNVLIAVVFEFALTFLLMLTIVSVATDERSSQSFAGLIIGLVIFVAALFGGPFSGASLNPARTIGPAVVSGNYSYLILYFLVPPLGAVAGAYLYEYIKHGKMPEKTKESYGTLGKIE